MDFIGGVWHLLNLYAPAGGIALFAAALMKLLWWRELTGVSWWRLWLWAAAWSALACTAGLVYFGRDGKMATYAAMVLACSSGLWWVGFGPGRR